MRVGDGLGAAAKAARYQEAVERPQMEKLSTKRALATKRATTKRKQKRRAARVARRKQRGGGRA